MCILKKSIAIFCITVALQCNADLLESVDQDVLSALVFNGQSPHPRIAKEIPDGFQKFKIPNGLKLIGSASGYSFPKVAFKTSLTPIEAELALSTAFGKEGYISLPKSHTCGSVHGFKISSRLSLCKVGQVPFLSIQMISAEEGYYAIVTEQTYGSVTPCEVSDNGDVESDGMAHIMPEFLVPHGQGSLTSSAGLGGEHSQAETSFNSKQNPSAISRYFGRQLSSHGWDLESTQSVVTGEETTWIITNGSQQYAGVLEVVKDGESKLKTSFSISPLIR